MVVISGFDSLSYCFKSNQTWIIK